jgi:hypothetical protein
MKTLLAITLFQEVKGEQMLRRRLNMLGVTKAQAEKKCKVVKAAVDRQHCVFDILATQDLDMVEIYID